MTTPKDVQDLLRMLTTGRNKLPMMAAMARMKSLQAVGIRSIKDIVTADSEVLNKAVGDEKAAKQLCSAAKREGDGTGMKRKVSDSDLVSSPDAKRKKSTYEITDEPQTPEELEESLALPDVTADEEEIRRTVVYCNRAPFMLVFAVALLKYTMPEQPLSSRLSLAQAVVSLNSRSKAVSLGITHGASAEEEGWALGQPKVRVMGREVYVLRRGGYDDNGEEPASVNVDVTDDEPATAPHAGPSQNSQTWTTSQKVSSKGSTFVTRSIGGVKSSSHARDLLSQLLSSQPELRTATHNATAWRLSTPQGTTIEESNDDGEHGAGASMLNILRSTNSISVMLVLTRWFGGTLLGPQRWELIHQVCHESLSNRLRTPGTLTGQALWGLDIENMKNKHISAVTGALPIHQPGPARSYILQAFPCPPLSSTAENSTSSGKRGGAAGTARERNTERSRNLGMLLRALDVLFASWVTRGKEELDRRAWTWYCTLRPTVESGPAGWGAKGELALSRILDLKCGEEGREGG